MKLAFTTLGEKLDSTLDPSFGRARNFLVYDLQTQSIEIISNTKNLEAAQGAGIQAAQTIAKAGAHALITGHCGPKAFRALEAAGIKVPRDVRVVGFDDVRYATLISVPLTTVYQPCRDLATVAFRAMLERIADPALPARNFVLNPRLVVRESCGAYLPKAAGGKGGN